MPVQVVPLRDRRSEIPELIAHFAEGLKSVTQPITLAPGLSSLLRAYDWPGVRELSNTVHRLSVLYPGQWLDLHDVDATMLPPGALESLSELPPPSGDDGADVEGLIEAEQADAASDVAAQKFLQDSVDASENSQVDEEFESIVMLAQGYEDFGPKGSRLRACSVRLNKTLSRALLRRPGVMPAAALSC